MQNHVAPLPVDDDRMTALAAAVRLGERRATLLFAGYDRPAQRGRLVLRLRRALPEKNLVALNLNDRRVDVRDRTAGFFEKLRALADEEAGGRRIDAVLLVGWERRLHPAALRDEQAATTLTGLFNRGRPHLKDAFPFPVVVFTPRAALEVIEDRAPDFVSWKSGVFSFPCNAQEVETGLRTTLAEERPADRAAAVVQVELLETALRHAEELDAGPLPDDLLPRTLFRLGELCLDSLGESERATERFAAVERWATDAEDGAGWAERARRARERAARTASVPKEDPWKVFRGAAVLDDEIFGRETDLERLLDQILPPAFRCGAVWGETGCGKSSLLRAGLAPHLRGLGHLPVVVDRWEGLEEVVCRAVAEAAGLEKGAGSLAETVRQVDARLGLKTKNRKVVLLCDQFERVFDLVPTREGRASFLQALAAPVNELALPFCCVFAVRADRLFHLFELDRSVPLYRPLAAENLYKLGFLRESDAVRVFEELREASGAEWDDELLDAVVEDLADDGRVRPVEIQLVAAALYLRDVGTVEDYGEAGQREGLLKGYLDAVLDELDRPELARRVVRSLVLSASPAVRAFKSLDEILEDVHGKRDAVEGTLEELEIRHVVQALGDGGARDWELVHDVLCEPCWRVMAPSELGLSVLRSAMRRRKRWLSLRGYWRALRADLDELPEVQRPRARRLLRWSEAFLVARSVMVAFLLLVGVQLSTAHVQIESEEPYAVRVYRGLKTFHGLPAPLGQALLFDTGLTDEDVPPNQRNQLLKMSFLVWDKATTERVERLHTHLDQLTSARRLCSLGSWNEGLKTLLLWDESPDFLLWRIIERSDLLRAFKRSNELLNRLLPFLAKPDPALRKGAASALGEIGSQQAATVVSQLLPLLKDPEASVRRATASALGQISSQQAATVVEQLLPLLKDPDADIRWATVSALGQIGSQQAAAVVPQILPLLKDSNASVRRATASARAKIDGAETEDFYSDLLTELRSDESQCDGRYRAAIVHSLAFWLHAGVPQKKDASSKSEAEPWRERAAKEQGALVAELDRLRQLERPWWLRVAAWDVFIEAERLH